MTLCPDCGEDVACPTHGADPVTGYTSDVFLSRYYSCEECLLESGSAFASLTHQCGPARVVPIIPPRED